MLIEHITGKEKEMEFATFVKKNDISFSKMWQLNCIFSAFIMTRTINFQLDSCSAILVLYDLLPQYHNVAKKC